MNTKTVCALLTDSHRFAETALHLQWADTGVVHIERADQNVHWVFLTEIRFPAGYVAAHFADAVVQADITHLCCTEELPADCFAHMNAEKRMQHLEMFAPDYFYKPEEFGHSLGCWTPEIYAEELQKHRGESDFAEQFFPLFARENEMIYLGMHGCTPCWDYLTVSGDTVLMTSLSVCC